MAQRVYMLGDIGPRFYDDEAPYPNAVLDQYGITTQDGFVTEGNMTLLEDGDFNGFFRQRFETFNVNIGSTDLIQPGILGESSTEWLVEEGENQTMAKVLFHDDRQAVAITTQPWGGYSNSSGTADTLNIFHDGSTFKIQNNMSTTARVFVHAKKFELGF